MDGGEIDSSKTAEGKKLDCYYYCNNAPLVYYDDVATERCSSNGLEFRRRVTP